MKKIPETITVGGQEIEIKHVERCENNAIGMCKTSEGIIEIARVFNKNSTQSETCKINTFYHELTHAILTTMGEYDLNENEKFVCCFAGFLNEAMKNAYFKKEGETNI